LAQVLRTNFFNQKNVEIINQDIFKINLPEVFGKNKYKVVANIPYNITSGFLELMLTLKNKPTSMTVLVQKEVAERVCARAGEMSILSLSVQLFGKPEIVAIVPAKSFWPSPKIESAILHISNIKEPKSIDTKKFFQLLHFGFSSRRKTLINNLSAGYHLSKSEVEKIVVGLGLLPTVRAQELSLDQWKKLLKNI
jgi:16S rRNA (adenine1518-N6/adenine1519-N6)-dimethyltransferase